MHTIECAPQIGAQRGTLPRCEMEARLPEYPTASGALSPGAYAIPALSSTGRSGCLFVEDNGIQFSVHQVPNLFGVHQNALERILRKYERVFVLIDPAIQRLYGHGIEHFLQSHDVNYVLLPLGHMENNELNKSLAGYEVLVSQILDHGPTQRDVILTIGGGVTSDFGGFVAATLRRGMDYISIPTTLASIVDAAISPKTAINVGRHKNAVGAVHAPRSVLYDPAFLLTVCNRDLKTGMAELIKLAVVRSSLLFEYLEVNAANLIRTRFQTADGTALLQTAIQLFLRMKYESPFYANRPASLRAFGHSFSRHLEGLSGFRLTHGEAVAVEMAIVTTLASNVGRLRKEERERIVSLILQVGLPIVCDVCTAERIWQVFRRRAECGHDLHIPMPTAIGSGTLLNNLAFSELAEALDWVVQRSQRSNDSSADDGTTVAGTRLSSRVMPPR